MHTFLFRLYDCIRRYTEERRGSVRRMKGRCMFMRQLYLNHCSLSTTTRYLALNVKQLCLPFFICHCRKYVRIDPNSIGLSHCSKAYANVYSSSMEDPYAIICCPKEGNKESQPYWSRIMGSYESALCAGKVRKVQLQ